MGKLNIDKVQKPSIDVKKYIKKTGPLTDKEFEKKKLHPNHDISVDDLKFDNSNFKASTYLKK